MSDRKKLVEVKDLCKFFPIKSGFLQPKKYVHAVNHVNLDIYKGETLGLVGESGCGKTTLGRTILRLYEPTSGKIIYDGKPIFDKEANIAVKMTDKNNNYRKKMQLIFQDPSASLDPRMTIGEIVGEAIDINKLAKSKAERTDMVNGMLARVGLNTEHANRFPHEFSGGQQQRVGIARALVVNPEFIVCDEPISALDVSIQAQVVNMLEDLQHDFGLTYLFIAHDLSVVRHISDRIGVMYLGDLVELTESDELVKNPLHPYTKVLMSAAPIPDPEVSRHRERIPVEGEIPSPVNPPSGCRFHPRCSYCMDRCKTEVPLLIERAPGHFVACHLHDQK